MSRSCYVCGSRNWIKRRGALRDDPEIGVAECQECGVVVPDGVPTVTVNYADGSMHGDELVSFDAWRSASRADDARRAGAVRLLVDASETVLDIGCGAGGLITELHVQGIHAIGVEPDSRTRSSLIEVGLEIWHQLNEVPESMRERVRVVTLFHVLEHVRDSRELLREISDLLPNARLCVVEVPCSEDPLLTLYYSEPFSNFTYWSHHEYLHSMKSLRALLCSVFAEVAVERVQRYGLGNHLGWLAHGAPGGQDLMPWFTDTVVDRAYRAALLDVGLSDTLWAQCAMTPR